MKRIFPITLAICLILTMAAPACAREESDPVQAADQTESSPAPTLEPGLPVETPAEPEAPAETPAEPEAPVETPAEPEAPVETPAETEPPVETPAESEPPAETPTEPVPTETPAEPSPTAPPAESVAPSASPAETEPPAETPAEPEVSLAPQPEETPDAVQMPMPIEAEDEVPIQVTVPQMGRIVINPYNLPVELDGEISTEQIAGETLSIVNESSVPVRIQASAVGYVSERSDMVYVNELPEQASEQKELFLYAEFQQEDGLWQGSYSGSDNQILVSTEASVFKDVLQLEAGPSEGVFRLFGAATVFPETEWGAEDEVSVTLTFTFLPLTEPDEALVLDTEPGGPEETPPQETDAPKETDTPKETDIPQGPGDLQDPDDSEKPEESQAPDTPQEPGDTQDPDASREPSDAQEPGEPQEPSGPQTPDEPQQPDVPQGPDDAQTPDEPQQPGIPQGADDAQAPDDTDSQ